jgi:uncharacterized protein YdeI (YjbR/CyaY-like superfamily)
MGRTVRLIVFFASADEMREWFEAHHDSAAELWVGIRESGSGGEGLTLAEALDQATCFGWVDNMTWRVDDTSCMLRFTRGRPRDIGRAERLKAEGRMQASGIRALEGRRKPCEPR